MYYILKGFSLGILVAYILLSLSFYRAIDLKLTIVMCILELGLFVISDLMTHKKLRKLKYKIPLIIISILIMFMSWLGFMSNGVNITQNIEKNSIKTVENPKYNEYIDKKETLENTLKDYKTEQQNYPSLDKYIESLEIPKWENKTEVTQEYYKNKKSIDSNVSKYQDKLSDLKAPDKTITTGTTKDSIGFNNTLNIVSDITKISTKNITLGLFGLAGILILILIYVLNFLANIFKPIIVNPITKKNKSVISNTKSEENNVISNTKVEEEIVENQITIEELPGIIDISKKIEQKKQVTHEISNKEKYLKYIKNNCDDNHKIPGLKKCSETLNISQREIQKYIKDLKNEGIIETKNKRTYLKGGYKNVK